MMKDVKLAEGITATVTVTYLKRPPLRAYSCDACGRIFKPKTDFPNRDKSGRLTGCFASRSAKIAIGSPTLEAHACSYKCAGELANGGWEKLDSYKTLAKDGAKLICTEFVFGELVFEEELRAEWEKLPVGTPPTKEQIVQQFMIGYPDES